MTTLVDVKNALFSHFITCSTFSLPDDLVAIKLGGNGKDGEVVFDSHKEDVVRFVLGELSKGGIVAQVTPTFYALVQPVNQLSQTLVVDALTAMMVADLVNDFVMQTGERAQTGYIVNQLALTNRDIAALCHICHRLLGADDMVDDPGAPPGGEGDRA